MIRGEDDLLNIVEAHQRMEWLNPRQLKIVKQRFGFGDAPCLLREIAEEERVGIERIRQIEGAALQRMRFPRPIS